MAPFPTQIFVPRADTVSRLKLNRTDFENHILRQAGGETSTTLISTNGKVRPPLRPLQSSLTHMAP